ncbi:MAG: polysaccharide export protein [Candidatus Omnitrophota bacterium]|nr:MAG: polysaccharide export protein [Candidatus Omnitrophota bacterium]
MRMSKVLTIGVVALMGFLLCSSQGIAQEQEQEVKGEQEAVQEVVIEGTTTTYTLGQGDVVEVLVRNQPEFSGEFVIGPDGNIQYTFVGDIQAEGLTKEQLKENLEKDLQKYVKFPEASVTILAYRSKFVYILGEVARPGKYPMTGDTVTLREALVAAGLPTPDAALRRVYVINPANEEPAFQKVDIFLLLYKGILKDNLTLASGDLIVVPSTIPSEINRALRQLLAPITRAAVVEDLIDGYK